MRLRILRLPGEDCATCEWPEEYFARLGFATQVWNARGKACASSDESKTGNCRETPAPLALQYGR